MGFDDYDKGSDLRPRGKGRRIFGMSTRHADCPYCGEKMSVTIFEKGGEFQGFSVGKRDEGDWTKDWEKDGPNDQT